MDGRYKAVIILTEHNDYHETVRATLDAMNREFENELQLHTPSFILVELEYLCIFDFLEGFYISSAVKVINRNFFYKILGA